MTASLTGPSPDQDIDRLVHLARERSAHGRATRSDWQRIYDLDPHRATTELRQHLQRGSAVIDITQNPYEHRPRRFGAAAGFVLGVIVMVALWLLIAWMRNTIVDSGPQWNAATFAQYALAVLPPLGAFAGARWEQRQKQAEPRERVSLRSAEFPELLQRFDATQRNAHARVY